jgi:cupin superfamily acireductone dioxygenase involved in methionine salvage
MSDNHFINLSAAELNIMAAILAELLTDGLDLKEIEKLLLFVHNLCDCINLITLDREFRLLRAKFAHEHEHEHEEEHHEE